MPQEGWEFFILDPTDKSLVTKQNIQDKYNEMYIKAYSSLLSEICIPNPCEIFKNNKDENFLFYINCSGTNDIINLGEDYEFNFLKSYFLENKFLNIKKFITRYYSEYGINIVNMYKDQTNYFFELSMNLSP